jgi:uncharacterized membrane protein
MPFTLPAAIALPIVTGFLLAGPILGFFVAVLVAAAVVVVAVRMKPRQARRPAAPQDAGDRALRAAAERFAVPLGIAAVGIVLIVVAGGTLSIIGWGVVAVAITVAISLVFLEVGYSEDRARARDERARSLSRRGGRGGRLGSHERGRDTRRGIRS